MASVIEPGLHHGFLPYRRPGLGERVLLALSQRPRLGRPVRDLMFQMMVHVLLGELTLRK